VPLWYDRPPGVVSEICVDEKTANACNLQNRS
jgi:hypothetical protein